MEKFPLLDEELATKITEAGNELLQKLREKYPDGKAPDLKEILSAQVMFGEVPLDPKYRLRSRYEPTTTKEDE